MSRAWRWVDGLALAAVGGWMAWLALWGDYWLFLNPKFQWLTLGTGAGLALLGLTVFFQRSWRGGAVRTGAFAVVLALMFLPGQWGGASAPAPTLSGGQEELARPETSRVERAGREYVRINTAELFLRGQKGEGADREWVVQGVLLRSPELDGQGQVAVARTAIFCCLADATAVGLRVRADKAEGLEAGQWVRVFGTLRRLPQPLPEPDVSMQGAFFTAVAEDLVLEPDAVEAVEAPQIPYIFLISESEPYNY